MEQSTNKKSNKKSGVLGGLFWSFGERVTAQLVTMIVTIVLARLLDPEHYGIISIVTVIITFLNVFVAGGFGSALIQNKNSTELDFNTAFWMSFILSVFLYSILFVCAPYIASFYENDLLTGVIRILGLRLIVASINSIQQASIRKRMEFRRFFWATLIGTVISGVAGIILAYNGFGVWALVAQYLTNVTIDTIVLFIVGVWFPKFQFSKDSAKGIWKFGWKVLATELVYTVEGDIRTLVVGKVFGPGELSYYDQGKKYPSLLVTNINASVQKVMLPAYSILQDDHEALLATLRKSIQVAFYILAPMLIGFAVVADNFVTVVLTDKWVLCIPFIQIFCLSYLTRPLESSCHQALLAIGKSGTVLITMIIINVFALSTVIVSVFVLQSVLWIAVFSLITTIVSCIVFFFFANRLLGYRFRDLMSDMLPTAIIVSIMGTGVFFMRYIPINTIALLIIQVLTGIVVYLAFSAIFKVKPFLYLTGKIRSVFGHKKSETNDSQN